LAGAFPPSGIIIVLRDLHEAELLVVVGADPLGGVDGALFQRRIDVAAGDLLRHAADLGDDGAGKTADPEFEPAEVIHRFDFLPEPAAHLGAGRAGRNADAAILLQEIVEHVLPAAPT